jgi:hypothetical protein
MASLVPLPPSIGQKSLIKRMVRFQKTARHLPRPPGQRLGRTASAAASPDDDAAGPGPQSAAGDDSIPEVDFNQLQTALNAAIAAENYVLAAKIRDVLTVAAVFDGGVTAAAAPADWAGLGVIDWLADRAESMGFRLPTQVQRRAAPIILSGRDCVIQSETGSGKTLSFLLPLLSLLRYPPDLYTDDLKGPQALILVPTRELGVQLVMLVFHLFGGSVNTGIPGERATIFSFKGPKGLKVRGLLLDDEVVAAQKEGYLKGAHVVVGTPDIVARVMTGPDGVDVARHCVGLAVDEVDACFDLFPEQMATVLDAACLGRGGQGSSTEEEGDNDVRRPRVILVGATADDEAVEAAARRGWVKDPVTVAVGPRMRVPKGLQHRFIVALPGGQAAVMARQIRADIKGWVFAFYMYVCIFICFFSSVLINILLSF